MPTSEEHVTTAPVKPLTPSSSSATHSEGCKYIPIINIIYVNKICFMQAEENSGTISLSVPEFQTVGLEAINALRAKHKVPLLILDPKV
jgi:hypothetical protein